MSRDHLLAAVGAAVVGAVVGPGCQAGEVGDIECPAHMRITGGEADFSQSPLAFELAVEEMPAELPFNQAGVGDGRLEYEWAVAIDARGSGDFGLEASVSHFKFGEPVTGPVLTHTQKSLWRVEGLSAAAIGGVRVDLDGARFKFSLERDAADELARVGAQSKAVFRTRLRTPDGTCSDRFDPDGGG